MMKDGHNFSITSSMDYKKYWIEWLTHRNKPETKFKEKEDYNYRCLNKNLYKNL